MQKKIDEAAAKAAFAQALASHSQEFERFFLARFLDLEFSYDADSSTVEMPVCDFMFNPQGTLHGGIIATLMDIAMGHLLRHVHKPGATLELKTQFLKAVTGGRVKVKASLLKRGRSVHFLRADLYDDAGVLCATATSTWATTP